MGGALQGAIGTMAASAAAAEGIVPDSSFTAWAVSANSSPGDVATAEFILSEDGSAYGFAADVDLSVPGSPAWYNPTGGNPGASYFVRYDVTSGAATTNSASSFISLASARNINCISSAGTGGCTFTILISSDISGTPLLFSKAGNTLAYSH